MMVITQDGILQPFGIRLSRESQMSLLAPANSITEENEIADGEIDFGTSFGNGEYTVRGIIEHETLEQRYTILNSITALFLQHLKYQELSYEAKPDIMTYAWLTDKPNFVFYPSWMDISFTLVMDPFWYSSAEHFLVGNGTIVNAGTREAKPTIEITGPATNPSLTIGDKTLTYTGTIPSGEKLIISVVENGAGAAKIGSANAMAGYNGVFPSLLPGNTTVVAGSNVTIRWRDCYL